MILADTSGMLAALFPDQRLHERCARVIDSFQGPFVLSPFVLAELDYLIVRHAGVTPELDFLAEVAGRAYELAAFAAEDVEAARSVIERYRDLGIGLADASLVVLARRYGTRDILTLDERHFRVLRGPRGHPFRLHPIDG